jgi:hypothetical protein
MITDPPAPKRLSAPSSPSRSVKQNKEEKLGIKRKGISKRIKFRDRPDFFRGRYFIFTFPYGVFFVSGGIIGYLRTENLFCLIISCFIGLLLLLLSIGHSIDYYNGASIEAIYISIPLCKNFLFFPIPPI